MGDYLHYCLALHGQLTEIFYGRRMQDLFGIEDETAGVLSRRQLTYTDVEAIRNSRIWNADMFGYWPPRSEVEPVLLPTNFVLAGQIAGIEFERILRKWTKEASWDLATIVDTHTPRLRRIFPRIKSDFWKRARTTRNRAVHQNPLLTKERVEELIQGLVEIERTADTGG